MSYVNTTAAVKAETDYCCNWGTRSRPWSTSARHADDTEILFLPDVCLGAWLRARAGRRLEVWIGECHVHAGIRPGDIGEGRA